MADQVVKKTKENKRTYIFAVGRRREAVARVRLHNPASGKVDMFQTVLKRGDVVVNGKQIQEYFRYFGYTPIYNKFLQTTNAENNYIFTVKVRGGGLSGQLDAVLHGMARALDKLDREKYHSSLKKNGYLTRDPRTRERRKVGNAGKARRKKSSPKR